MTTIQSLLEQFEKEFPDGLYSSNDDAASCITEDVADWLRTHIESIVKKAYHEGYEDGVNRLP
jgi:hypothetical protein